MHFEKKVNVEEKVHLLRLTTNACDCFYKMPRWQLDELVKLILGLDFSNKEILSLLAQKHTVVTNIRTLKILCQQLRLFQRINHTSLKEVASFVQTEIVVMYGKNGQMWGYNCMCVQFIGVMLSTFFLNIVFLSFSQSMMKKYYLFFLMNGPNTLL